MKKRLQQSIFVLVFVLAFSSITACSTTKQSPDSQSQSTANVSQNTAGTKTETVELQFWDMVWGGAEYIDSAKALTDKFNQEHPNIKVNYKSTAWDNYYQAFTTALASGTGPDISTGSGYQAFQFAKEGAILPIDDYIDQAKKDGDLEDFYPNMIDAMKYDGHYVAFPWATDVRVPYYRKDILDSAGIAVPTNWDELAAALKKLSGKGKHGLALSSDNLGVHALWFFMFNNGGGAFTPDGKVDMLYDRNVETMQYLSDLVKSGAIDPAGAGFKKDDALKAFAQGDAAFMINTPGLKSELPNLKDKIGIMSPIKGPHGDTGTINWINNIMLYKQSKHPDEAKIFLKWWSQNNLDLFVKGKVGQFPVRKSFLNDPLVASDPDKKMIIEQWLPIAKTTASRNTSIFPELAQVEDQGVMQAAVQKLMLKKDPKDILSEAQKIIEGFFK
jgi:multiple sugar transport system substrate-binding protein